MMAGRGFVGLLVLISAILTPNSECLAQEFAELPKSVIAAVPRHFPPMYDINGSGKPIGYAIDVMDAIARRTGLSIRYVAYPNWNAVNDAMLSGEADLIPNSGISDDRAKQWAFSDPISEFDISFFVLADRRDLVDWHSLEGKAIGVSESNAAVKRLEAKGLFQLVKYMSYDESLIALFRGDVDALVHPAPVAWRKAYEVGLAGRMREVASPIMTVKRAIAVRIGRRDLIPPLNAAIPGFLESTEHAEIYQRWYGWSIPFLTVERVAAIAAALVFVIVAIMVFWRIRVIRRINLTLLESEARFRRILENVPLIGVSLDAKGKIVFANHHFLDLTGWTAEEILGRDWFQTCIPESIAEEIEGVFRNAAADLNFEGISNYENDIRTRDGCHLRVAWFNVVSLKKNNQVMELSCLGVDMTERVRAEEKLQNLNLRMSLANQSAGIGVWEWDLATNQLDWDEGMLSLYDIPAETFDGSFDMWQGRLHPDDRDRAVSESQASLEHRKPFDTEFRIVRPDGRVRSIKASAVVVQDDAGNPTRLTGVSYDITDLRTAEAALRESEARLMTVMDNSPAPIYLKDLDGRLILSNRAHLRHHGVEAEQILGRTTWDYDPSDIAAENARMREWSPRVGKFVRSR